QRARHLRAAAERVRRGLRRLHQLPRRLGARPRRRGALPRAHRDRRPHRTRHGRPARRRQGAPLGAAGGRGPHGGEARRHQRARGEGRRQGLPGRMRGLPGEARRAHAPFAPPPVAAQARGRSDLRAPRSRQVHRAQGRLRNMQKKHDKLRIRTATRTSKYPVSPTKTRWASDVIVDLLHMYDLPHASLNPGASYRGLHDSIVNYGQNRPTMMLCQHEETAVQIAHGYAKATGKPVVAVLQKQEGLLHANMAIYYAYIDRAPVFIVGATGPMDETKRRPRIDWIHTAKGQGEAVRQYTKWDYQPHTIDGVPESFARAYGVMMTQPQGPVYMIYDAWLQEQELDHPVALPRPDAVKVPARIGPDPAALRKAADMIAAAEHPVIIAEYTGRDHEAFDALVKLAETAGIPVHDINGRLNFPSRHPLNASLTKDHFRDADLVICMDARDWEKPTTELVSTTRQRSSVVPAGAKWIEIGFGDLELSSWALDYQRMNHADLRVMADTTLAIPMLTEMLQAKVAGDRRLAAKVKARIADVSAKTKARRAKWAAQAKEDWDASPITLPRLASEVWNAIRGEDWVLTAGTLEDWTRKLWDFDRPYRHPGKSLGTS